MCCSVSGEVRTDGDWALLANAMVKSIGCGLARTLAPQITLGYCLSQLSETFSHQPIVTHRQSAQ